MIPEKWKKLLETQESPNATNYDYSVQVNYPDGTNALFKNAFYVINPSENEVAIFTEHNGNHILSYLGIEIDLLKSSWTEVGTADLITTKQ